MHRARLTLEHTFSLKESDSILAVCCIWFLRFTDFERYLEQINDDESESDIPGMHRPFLSYAAEYWTAHYKEDTSDDPRPIEHWIFVIQVQGISILGFVHLSKSPTLLVQ
jgi:hypothetical protein